MIFTENFKKRKKINECIYTDFKYQNFSKSQIKKNGNFGFSIKN